MANRVHSVVVDMDHCELAFFEKPVLFYPLNCSLECSIYNPSFLFTQPRKFTPLLAIRQSLLSSNVRK